MIGSVSAHAVACVGPRTEPLIHIYTLNSESYHQSLHSEGSTTK